MPPTRLADGVNPVNAVRTLLFRPLIATTFKDTLAKSRAMISQTAPTASNTLLAAGAPQTPSATPSMPPDTVPSGSKETPHSAQRVPTLRNARAAWQTNAGGVKEDPTLVSTKAPADPLKTLNKCATIQLVPLLLPPHRSHLLPIQHIA